MDTEIASTKFKLQFIQSVLFGIQFFGAALLMAHKVRIGTPRNVLQMLLALALALGIGIIKSGIDVMLELVIMNRVDKPRKNGWKVIADTVRFGLGALLVLLAGGFVKKDHLRDAVTSLKYYSICY